MSNDPPQRTLQVSHPFEAGFKKTCTLLLNSIHWAEGNLLIYILVLNLLMASTLLHTPTLFLYTISLQLLHH